MSCSLRTIPFKLPQKMNPNRLSTVDAKPTSSFVISERQVYFSCKEIKEIMTVDFAFRSLLFLNIL